MVHEERQEIILFEDDGIKLEVPLSPDQDTVWLNRNQMAELFERDVKTIGKHIGNALKEELDHSTVAKFATVQKEGDRQVIRDIEYYNLDMIISVGYRVKSKRGIAFRKWANSVLKQYILRGYAVNHNRMTQLGEVIRIMKRTEYSLALNLLEDYDHQTMNRPAGNIMQIQTFSEMKRTILLKAALEIFIRVLAVRMFIRL